jgi:predicted RNA-binding protein YlxR (DUF448 family)
MRMCILTREKLPKKELIRVVNFNGEVSVDVTGKKNGKGCYLKRDASVINEAKNKKILNHVFEMDVPEEIYDEILKLI